MARLNFPGKPREWLEAHLSRVLDDLVTGKTLSNWGTGEVSAGKHIYQNLHPERLRDMLLEDLNCRWPDEYPADLLVVKATTAKFVDGP